MIYHTVWKYTVWKRVKTFWSDLLTSAHCNRLGLLGWEWKVAQIFSFHINNHAFYGPELNFKLCIGFLFSRIPGSFLLAFVFFYQSIMFLPSHSFHKVCWDFTHDLLRFPDTWSYFKFSSIKFVRFPLIF